MDYNIIYTSKEIHAYIGDAGIIAFDFETAPDDNWRDEPKAALDAHKAHIVGISLSFKDGSAVYIPLAHKMALMLLILPMFWNVCEKLYLKIPTWSR